MKKNLLQFFLPQNIFSKTKYHFANELKGTELNRVNFLTRFLLHSEFLQEAFLASLFQNTN